VIALKVEMSIDCSGDWKQTLRSGSTTNYIPAMIRVQLESSALVGSMLVLCIKDEVITLDG